MDELKRLKEESTLIDLVYQRAISDHPLDSGLWKDYITFLVSSISMLLVSFPNYPSLIPKLPFHNVFDMLTGHFEILIDQSNLKHISYHMTTTLNSHSMS